GFGIQDHRDRTGQRHPGPGDGGGGEGRPGHGYASGAGTVAGRTRLGGLSSPYRYPGGSGV
ncbi:MAG: hypothetical protein AVDCRST_MAG12-3078, partial [uncultured Rubrobacteraceae bacterium]